MKKSLKIIVIVLSSLLAVAGCVCAALFLFPKRGGEENADPPAEKKGLIENTVDTLFPDLFGIGADLHQVLNPDDGKLSVNLSLSLDGKLVDSTKPFTAELLYKSAPEGYSLRTVAGKGKNSLTSDVSVTGGRYGNTVTFKGSGTKSYGYEFALEGAADALDASPLNPKTNPDSPLNEEGYAAFRSQLLSLESEWRAMRDRAGAAADDAGIERIVRRMLKELKNNVEYSVDRTGDDSERISFSMDCAAILRSLNALENAWDSYALFSGAGFSADTSVASGGTSFSVRDFVTSLRVMIKESGLEADGSVEYSGNLLNSVRVRLRYSDYPESDAESGEENEKPEKVGFEEVITVVADYEKHSLRLNGETKADGELTEVLVASISCRDDGDLRVLKAGYSLTEKGVVSERDKVTSDSVEIRYSPVLHTFSLYSGGGFLLEGYLFADGESAEIRIDKLEFRDDRYYFEYGEGISSETEFFELENPLKIVISRLEGEITPVEKQDDLFSMDSGKVSKLVAGGEMIGDLGEFLQNVLMPDGAGEKYTADGYRIVSYKKVNMRASEILGLYKKYLTNLGSNAFTEESAYVLFYDEDESGLYFVLSSDGKKSEVLTFLFPPEEVIRGFHPSAIIDGQFVIHDFEISDADPVCGEKEYKIGTCRICGLQLAYYTGNTWQHRYVSRDIETYSLRNPGKKTTATLTECQLCGEADYFCEYIRYHYTHTENGYTLRDTSFESGVTNGLYFRAGFPVGDEKTVISEGGTCWGSSVIAYCIEKNVTRIETGAFRHDVCLQSVVLPAGLEYIGEDAFFNCPRLKTVYFRGTEEEWKKIDLTNNGAYLSGVKIVFNYGEGDTSFAKNLVTPERYYTLYSNLNKAYELTVFSPVSAVGKTAGVIAVTGFVKEGASASGIWADSVTGRIAFSVYDGAQVLKVYDSKTGSQVGRISPDYGSRYETAAGDGMFALLGGNRMVIYNAATLEKKKELTFAELSEGGTPECLAVARGMVFFVFRKNPNLIYCCDPETGSLSIVSGVSGLTEGDYYSPRFSVSADGGTLLLSLAQKAVTVDTGSLTATGIVDVKQTSDYVFFNGNGFTFVSFGTYNTTVNGAYKSTDRFPVYSYLEPGAGIVHKNAESMFKAAGYTPFDFLYSDGSVDVFTAYDKNGTFYTLFVRGGKVRAVRAVGRSLLPLGDGRFIIWNGSDCAIIVNAP